MKSINPTSPNRWTSFLAGALLAVITILMVLVIFTIGYSVKLTLITAASFNQTLQSINLSGSEIIDIGKIALSTPKDADGFTLLLLGTDQLENRGADQTILTDTIMLVHLNPISKKIILLPIPRDTWLDAPYYNKINTLYGTNLKDDPNLTLRKTKKQFLELFKLPIDQVMVIDMQAVQKLIDTLGGVTIDVPTSFTDYRYPRSDVDVTSTTDPRLLYETVEFEKGLATMSGELALKYMRSRHALGTEGNDMARSRRQQQVLMAVFDQTTSALEQLDPEFLLAILDWYNSYLRQQLSPTTLASMIFSLSSNPVNYQIVTRSLPILPEDPNGVLVNPRRHSSGQWVFVIPSIDAWQQEIRSIIQ